MPLQAKNKMVFEDGTLPSPKISDPLKLIWDRNNKTMLSWIVRRLEIAQSVLFRNKASKVWLELRQRLSQGNRARITNLREELYSLRQCILSITTFFTQLKALWSELGNFSPI